MREPEGFRETVQWITEQTGKGWLTNTEIANLLGVDRKTVKRRFGISNGCAVTVLAKRMVQESG